MKRVLPSFLVSLALVVSACAVGEPKPATYVSDTGITLNANIRSSVQGPTEFWVRYGQTDSYGRQTFHRTGEITTPNEPVPISQPIGGLRANTTYHWQFCVQDEEESPPRRVCNWDQTFTTGPAGGRTGIGFTSTRDGNDEIYAMDGDGANQINLSDNSGPDTDASWSPDATRIAFVSEDTPSVTDVFAMDSSDGGNRENLTDDAASDHHPAWSPDGLRIAFVSDRDGNQEIYVMDSDGSDQTRLTDNAGEDTWPTWSPDGERIAFASVRGGQSDIYAMKADGSDQAKVTDDISTDATPAWGPDGTKIAFASQAAGSDYEVHVMDADGGNATPLTANSAYDAEPTWSPDGQKLAFGSDRDGNDEIYAMDADGGNQTNLSANSFSDAAPAWSPRPVPPPPGGSGLPRDGRPGDARRRRSNLSGAAVQRTRGSGDRRRPGEPRHERRDQQQHQRDPAHAGAPVHRRRGHRHDGGHAGHRCRRHRLGPEFRRAASTTPRVRRR